MEGLPEERECVWSRGGRRRPGPWPRALAVARGGAGSDTPNRRPVLPGAYAGRGARRPPLTVCADACGVFAAAIAEGIRSGDRDAMLRTAQAHARTDTVKDDLGRAELGEIPEDYRTNTGWVRIALQNAFWHLRRGATVEEALVATVGKGGDTDTNAAITGALLGAADGLSAIPSRWVVPVQACRPHASLGAPNPRPMSYWPDDLAAIAEALLITRPATENVSASA